jgi:hypothetical protein
MHDGRRSAVANRTPHCGDVADVAFDHGRVERGTAMPGGKIVVNDDAVTGTPERLGSVTANVPGAAGDEDGWQISCGQWSNR